MIKQIGKILSKIQVLKNEILDLDMVNLLARNTLFWIIIHEDYCVLDAVERLDTMHEKAERAGTVCWK